MEFVNENGNYILENKVFKDIAQIATLKIKDVFVAKKENDFVSIKVKDNEVSLLVSVRLLKGIDVVDTCSKIQKAIYQEIKDCCGICVNSINIDIQGFEEK